jgi:hypothetical protein
MAAVKEGEDWMCPECTFGGNVRSSLRMAQLKLGFKEPPAFTLDTVDVNTVAPEPAGCVMF